MACAGVSNRLDIFRNVVIILRKFTFVAHSFHVEDVNRTPPSSKSFSYVLWHLIPLLYNYFLGVRIPLFLHLEIEIRVVGIIKN